MVDVGVGGEDQLHPEASPVGVGDDLPCCGTRVNDDTFPTSMSTKNVGVLLEAVFRLEPLDRLANAQFYLYPLASRT